MGIRQYGFFTKNHDLTEFLLTSNSMAILKKSEVYDKFIPWLGTGLLTAEGTKWKQRRRIITPSFHFSILEQFVDVFEENGNILLSKFKEVVDRDSVNIFQYVTDCTLDILSESAMGVSIKSQEGKNKEYVTSVKEFNRILITRAFSATLSNDYLFMLTGDYKIYKRSLKIMHDFTNSVIENRMKELKNKKDNHNFDDSGINAKRRLAFLDLLLNATIDGKPLSKEDVREEVDTFMFEGHDTTAFSILMTLYLLADHQDIQTLARNEQKDIFGSNKEANATLQDFNEMKYLDLVIRESLRIFPSVAFVGREVTEDIEYKGNIIPKGTVASIFIYGINKDRDYHEKPDEFIPERHLTSNGKHFSYIPFSAGPRNCIGQKFAMLEMKSVISKILRNFELLPAIPVYKPILAMEAIFRPTNGVNIRLRNCKWD